MQRTWTNGKKPSRYLNQMSNSSLFLLKSLMVSFHCHFSAAFITSVALLSPSPQHYSTSLYQTRRFVYKALKCVTSKTVKPFFLCYFPIPLLFKESLARSYAKRKQFPFNSWYLYITSMCCVWSCVCFFFIYLLNKHVFIFTMFFICYSSSVSFCNTVQTILCVKCYTNKFRFRRLYLSLRGNW